MTETPDRTESVFAAAVALATAEERAAYLDRACAGDTALRGHVEALLRAHERAGHLLDRPIPGGPEPTGDYLPREQPGTVIAGRTAALMHGLWLPDSDPGPAIDVIVHPELPIPSTRSASRRSAVRAPYTSHSLLRTSPPIPIGRGE